MKIFVELKKRIDFWKMKLEMSLKSSDSITEERGITKIIVQCFVIRNKIRYVRQEISKVIKSISEKSIPYGKREQKSIYELPYVQEVRKSALERAAREIYEKKVEGCVAEAGVYRGEFARHINWWFYDRKMYLIDTFEGFDERDMEIDKKYHHSIKYHDWRGTSVQYVLSRMPNKKNCIVKKGWFPEIMKNVEDKFCFVSLDMDLYEPIYAGLEYFYPKLSGGGIFLSMIVVMPYIKEVEKPFLILQKRMELGM